MKKIFMSLAVIALVSAVAVSATRAAFSDTETLAGNTFAAGSLDLVLGDSETTSFSSDGLVPGQTLNAGTVEVENNGSLAGKFTLMVSNPESNENGLLGPEIADGDLEGQEIDPTGYDANNGDGELWDMASMTIYVDLNNDGEMQWNEPVIWRGDHLDMTTGSGFRIPLDTDLGTADLEHGFDGTLDPDESIHVGLLVKFKDDSQLASQPQYNGLTNNMAMSDDMKFDLIFGLEQI